MGMRVIIDPRSRLNALDDPAECWLRCDECSRFFQYRNAGPSSLYEHDACPFPDCCGAGIGFELFIWDDKREPEDPLWPSSSAQLFHGMRSPDPEAFHHAQVERRRAQLIAAFVQSPEWAQLQRTDGPRYLRPLMHMLSDSDCDLAGGEPMVLEIDAEYLFSLPIYCRTAEVAEAPAVMAELRAFFSFARRTQAVAEPEAWLALLATEGAELQLREGLLQFGRAPEQPAAAHRRRRARPRPVRDKRKRKRERSRRARRRGRQG